MKRYVLIFIVGFLKKMTIGTRRIIFKTVILFTIFANSSFLLAQQSTGAFVLPKDELIIRDNLATEDKELIIETTEWKVVFSLFYNGGIYQMFDKVYDPKMQDNLLTGPWYSQGGIFDYDVYLWGDQEFMTTVGRNNNPGRASLEILENTPVRLRVRQKCYPRLNNADGPRNDRFIESDMVHTTTEWTFYPTGRINIKFDAVVPEKRDEIRSQGPGGEGKGINVEGNRVTAVNGTNFVDPWVTHGDSIESSKGGWGPIGIDDRIDEDTLILSSEVEFGTNLDFIIRRTNILDETFSIHADGDDRDSPYISYWQGGSNGDILFENMRASDLFRDRTPPVEDDYVLAHWTRSPRQFGSLLAFYELFRGANYSVFNDTGYKNLSYTQVARRGWRMFREHHRYFMAHLGTEKGKILPRIKSVADALPYADDYRNPYAEARVGKLQEGAGFHRGYNLESGAYHVEANENKIAEIVFDTMRGVSVESAIAYYEPAIFVSGLKAEDKKLVVELSKNNGATFEKLPGSLYNITSKAESYQLGADDKRLVQLLFTIPAYATGEKKWVIRFRKL
ncbi:MAG: hypothetical protein PHW62_05875 [Candidatus Ratteibacteria bacterium]|nr:hypothetical protein [Candidatus Ratteibacteria bacterium]